MDFLHDMILIIECVMPGGGLETAVAEEIIVKREMLLYCFWFWGR